MSSVSAVSPRIQSAPVRLAARIGWGIFAAILLYLGSIEQSHLQDFKQLIVLECGIAIIMAVSLNIVNGFTGQFAIGHAGFMSVGAYTGASVTYALQQGHYQVNTATMLLAMLAGGLLAAVFGWMVGVPSLRLRGDYLAIVTLGFGEIIRILLNNSGEISDRLKYLGGSTGFYGASNTYQIPHLTTFILLFATVIAIVLLIRNLKFSSHGLAFMSIREDEIAADAMGVNTTQIKVSAFTLSAFFAGVGGALFAHLLPIQPSTFNFILSMNYVVMIVLGGTGSITGATMAAVVLTALPSYLQLIQEKTHFTDEYRQVIYALILVLMMLLRPGGVFGMGELSFAKLRRLFRKADISADNSETAAPVPESPQGDAATVSPAVSGSPVMLNIANMTRRFGGLTAVSEVNIRLDQGELVGLIGPNGAGKTTLFNLLTGVYAPSEGTLDFDGSSLAGERLMPAGQRIPRLALDAVLAGLGGYVIGFIFAGVLKPNVLTAADATVQNAIKAAFVFAAFGWSIATAKTRRRYLPGLKPFQFAQRGISRTFQNIRLFGELTVLENVRIGSYCRRHTNLFDALFRTSRLEREEAEGIERARALLSRFNLLRVENEQAKNLPYGDQRRLEIVRALATNPKLLLLDEPAAGMNPQEKTELMGLIRQIRDAFDLTILLIEHDMKLVMGVCERIYVLEYGRIIAEGLPAAIRANPKVIAAYLGEEFEDGTPETPR